MTTVRNESSASHDAKLIEAEVRDEKRTGQKQDKVLDRTVYPAQLTGFSDGRPVLIVGDNKEIVVASAHMIPLGEDDLGKTLAVMSDYSSHTNRRSVVVIGEMQSSNRSTSEIESKIELKADSEIVFKCGKAMLKMTADGTISIRGANVVSRASNTNRIRGGNVQIN